MTTPRKKSYWLRVLLVLAVLAGLLAGGAAWLASSETAFAWALARLQVMSGGRLKVEGVRGTLFGPIAIDSVAYSDESLQVRAEEVRLTWLPWALLEDHLAIGAISTRQVSLRLLPSGGAASARASAPTSVALPLRVSVGRASIHELEIARGDSQLRLQDITLGYEGDRQAHRVHTLRVVSEWGTLEASGELGGRDPFPVTAKAVLLRAPGQEARFVLSGTLRRLAAHADADFDGIRASADSIIAPFAVRWLEKLDVHAENIDLARLIEGEPASEISLTLNAAGRDARSIAGTLRASNAAAGTLDEKRLPVRQVDARFATDFVTAKVESIEIALLLGGRFSGSGGFADGRATLALDANAINLQGVYARLLATALGGRVAASFDGSTETVNAQLAQGPLSIHIDAERRGPNIEVRNAHLAARGGRVEANGRLALAGDMPVTARAVFNGFDPSEWGNYPAASVNGTLDLEGALARRSGELSFALTKSRFRSATASGKGSARVTDQRIESADVVLEVGANRLSAHGAFGGPGDTLAISLAAPRLAELEPRTQGRVDAHATMSGSWQAPQISFTASGVDVRLSEALAIGTFGASGAGGWSPGAPLQIDAEGSDMRFRGVTSERVALQVKGTSAQHAIDVTAKSKTADFAARLVGGWRAGHGWVGTLAKLDNRGALPISLESPASLEVAPTRAEIAAMTLRVGGGHIALGATHVAPGNVTTSGDFEAMPAALLVALAGAGDLVDSTLLLGGSWRLAATPRLNGSIRVARESGDLVFRTDPKVALGLSKLELDGSVVDERATGRLSAQGTEILIDARGEALPVGAGPAAGLALDSPISLSAQLDVPSLAPIAALLRTRANLDGRVRAQLTAAGTLGKPVWKGRVDADDVRIQSPPIGIDWHDGKLRAEIAENAVRVTELSIAGGAGRLTAEGLATRTGDERSGRVSWRAERFAALNRPDRNLTLSGSGTVVGEARQVTLRGTLRADSGHFEFDPQGTLELGDDVVIAGRQSRQTAASQGERRLPVVVDFDLDMGDDLTVRGAGLDAQLVGSLKVHSLPTGQVLGDGVIRTRRGTFRAYGQRLVIERGRLIFDGPIENPALDVAAWRRNQAVEAGVEVKGPLRAPLIRVVSNPSVTESEQLAWLVLGHPAESGSQTDYAALQIAASALLGAASGKSQQSFANMVGLDEIGIASDRTGGQAVTVGKRLSDRIFVSYEQSINAALAVLRLEYALTRRLSARAETGTRSGMDIFYRYSFD
jgi:translocation and assembly module TamB